MHIHKCINIHICAQPAAIVFADVYVGVKTHLCNVHTCVQNICSKVHATLTVKKRTYIHTHTHMHTHSYAHEHTCACITPSTRCSTDTETHNLCTNMHTHTHTRVCNTYIYIYIYTCTCIYIYMSAHIHTYTYIHTRIQNVHMSARKARLKRRRGSDCVGSPIWRQEAPPFSLSAAIGRGIPFVASSPIARPRGTTDKRRTITTNSSSSHHHDSVPSRPHPLICTGAEPIHPVHSPPKLPAWPWPPETRSFSFHFGGFFFKQSLAPSLWPTEPRLHVRITF